MSSVTGASASLPCVLRPHRVMYSVHLPSTGEGVQQGKITILVTATTTSAISNILIFIEVVCMQDLNLKSHEEW